MIYNYNFDEILKINGQCPSKCRMHIKWGPFGIKAQILATYNHGFQHSYWLHYVEIISLGGDAKQVFILAQKLPLNIDISNWGMDAVRF